MSKAAGRGQRARTGRTSAAARKQPAAAKRASAGSKRSAAPARKVTTGAAPRRAKSAAARVAPDITAIEQFLYREARLLDERKFEAWRDLFTEDGIYWMPTQPDSDPDQVVSVYYDDRSVMASRIRRLRHPDAHIQIPASRTAHLVTNIEAEPASGPDGDVVVHATFIMTEFRRSEPRWLSGRYRYQLVPTADGLRIRRKTVVLINCDAPLPAMAIYA